MTILYRTAGAWGAGLGRRLTKAEVDNNWYQLQQQITTLGASIPAAARSVDDITVTSGDQLNFVMSDASTIGPFTLPSVTNQYKGAWAASTAYVKYDRVTNNGNLYEVLYPHTSGLTFDANANDGLGHNYYVLILSNPGASLPSGGPTGWLLAKNTSADFDFGLIDPASLSLPFTSITGVATAAQLPAATLTTIGGVKLIAAVANKFVTSITSGGTPILGQPAFTDISGTIDPAQLPAIAVDPLPILTITGNTTLTTSYESTYTRVDSASTVVVTVPPFVDQAWSTAAEMTFRQAGNGQLQFAAGAGVTLVPPTGYDPKALTKGAVITLKYVGSNTWDVFGLLALTP